MDISKLVQILRILDDRAITAEEGTILIEAICEILDKLRPQLKKWWLRVVLDGVKVSLTELKEHLEEMNE
jgi:hypothetical protein